MTRDEAETMIRASTAQDAPSTRTTQAQLQAWIEQAYKRLRRLISGVAPGLYSATSATQALTSADPDFDLSGITDYDRLIRFERQDGTSWDPVVKASDLVPYDGGFLEEAGVLRVFPPEQAAGTYRIVYVKKPTVSGNYTIEVPDGCEEVITEAVGFRAVRRAGAGAVEDEGSWKAEMDRLWREQRTEVRRRYGNHAEGGLVETGWGF